MERVMNSDTTSNLVPTIPEVEDDPGGASILDRPSTIRLILADLASEVAELGPTPSTWFAQRPIRRQGAVRFVPRVAFVPCTASDDGIIGEIRASRNGVECALRPARAPDQVLLIVSASGLTHADLPGEIGPMEIYGDCSVALVGVARSEIGTRVRFLPVDHESQP